MYVTDAVVATSIALVRPEQSNSNAHFSSYLRVQRLSNAATVVLWPIVRNIQSECKYDKLILPLVLPLPLVVAATVVRKWQHTSWIMMPTSTTPTRIETKFQICIGGLAPLCLIHPGPLRRYDRGMHNPVRQLLRMSIV